MPVRKTVTIVFADLAGSTALGETLDPEALRDLQARYFSAMRRPLERHGGTIEKYIGDAVMAIFGIPVLHEDDALRAVRAALEMRDGLARLNRELQRDFGVDIEVRIGVNTGEVAGDFTAGHDFVAGDAVNTAARLQTAAPPGGIVVGRHTRELVEGRVRLRPHQTVEVKGKRTPIEMWEVVALAAEDAPGSGAKVPLVGRRAELRRLHRRFERVSGRGQSALVTVCGPAGIGKSRVIREFLAGLGERATVVTGRCLPYGEGITYWPLREISHQLDGGGTGSGLTRLLGSQPAEVQWAVRQLFTELGATRPLVVVFDDIHWAEPAMLDLIASVGTRSEAPVMVVCSARGELFETRPEWAAIGGRGSVIRLEPLTDRESSRLLARLATRRRADVRREQVMAAAEGNPLFLEQFVAMRADDPETQTPPTIQALLAARIDTLPAPERRVIEAAAIEGRGFHKASVEALLGTESEIGPQLDALERRELIRPARSEFAGEVGYRFTHILVRDTAYELLPKRRRADLHTSYAAWMHHRTEQVDAFDELCGYHLEQAYRSRVALGRPDDERHRALATSAAGHLGSAGRRALDAGDHDGAANLLRRASALHLENERERAVLMIHLGGVLRENGRFADAEVAVNGALATADRLDDASLRARADVERLLTLLQVAPDRAARETALLGGRLESVLEASDDQAGLARLWHLRALLRWIRGHAREAEQAWRTSETHARLAGDEGFASGAIGWEASALYHGPTPATAAIERCERILTQLEPYPWAGALALQPLAGLRAMRLDFDEAFRLVDRSMTLLAEYGATVDAAVSHQFAGVAIMAGRPELAVEHLRTGRRRLARMGERAILASTDGYLAVAQLECGNLRAAARHATICERSAGADDLSAQVTWRRVRARVLAADGKGAAALELAHDAVELANTTDFVEDLTGSHLDLAEVLTASGRATEARAPHAAAVEIANAKEHLAALSAFTNQGGHDEVKGQRTASAAKAG